MCIFCAATFFQFGTRLLHFMGFEQFILDDENTLDLIKEGRDLMLREKNKLLNDNSLVKHSELVPHPKASGSIKFSSQVNYKRPDRENSREMGKNELISDIESAEHSIPPTTDYRSFERRAPPKDLFDDI